MLQTPPKVETPLDKRMHKPQDYVRLMQVRALELEGQEKKMVVEGRAVVFDEPTTLFTYDNVEYKEVISKGAFAETDISKCYFKYNHSDSIMAMARVKSKTLSVEIRDDGVYIRADLADTSAGRDLFTLVKRGDIDQMSFAFTIREESFDQQTHTWTVRKVGILYDVAAVEQPAYEATELYARRYDEVVAQRSKEVEALALAKMRAQTRLNIIKNT